MDTMLDISEVKGIGFIGSLALHGLVLVLVALSSESQAPPPSVRVVAVNLVRLSDISTSLPTPQKALVPQDKASTVPQSEAVQATLAPIVAPQPQTLKPTQPSAPYSGAPQKPRQEMDSPKVVVKPVSHSTTTLARAPSLSPNEQLTTPLKLSAGLRPTVRPTSNNARRQDGTGLSNITAADADTVPGRDAAHAVKHFTRAQPKSFETRHHSRNATRSSRAKVEAWPPKWKPNRPTEDYPTNRQLLQGTLSGNGSRRVAAVPVGASAPSSNGTAPSSSSTAAAGNSNSGTAGDGTSSGSSSSSSSSGSGTHGASATHGASIGGLGGFASGVGHAGVPGAAHGGGRGGR